MDEPTFVEAMSRFAEQIAYVDELPARSAKHLQPESELHPRVIERLETQGRWPLYTHQAMAYDAAQRGEDVLLVTGTASGKTLGYHLPTVQAWLTEPSVRALYLFPTKALAQDQVGRFNDLAKGLGIRASTYDGDTPQSQRSAIRRGADVVLTNPDMLHIGILPSHELWATFLKRLRYIVIDEMHTYRGVFGSHVGNVIRRLLRLCEWHQNRPQIIACTATIGNPQQVFRQLTGRSPTIIDDDGSPQSPRVFVFWNPPMLDSNTRASANMATSEIMATLLESGQRVMSFCRARVSTELVLRSTRERLSRGSMDPSVVESYRAGYTPKERRQIEKSLFKGELRGLVATNAMELGVDVGGLDVVVMNGYPGTVSSFWQQSGRAGRGPNPGLAIMVARDDPLEQFLIRNPEQILDRAVESVALDPENPTILTDQLRCAAHERPLGVSEIELFGESALELAEGLDRAGDLRFQGGRFYYPAHESPARNVNIRSAGGSAVTLMIGSEALGSMERSRALQNAHAGAVYLHRGQSYLVDELDLANGIARVHAEEVPYYTQPLVESLIECLRQDEPFEIPLGTASMAHIRVTDAVVGYKQKALDGERVLGLYELDLPSETFETRAIRFDLPTQAPPDFDPTDAEAYLAAIHGCEHALMAVAPFLAGCDRGDLGSVWYGTFPETLAPAIFVFDRVPGGVGLADRLADQRVTWLRSAWRLLDSCGCDVGCPGCLLSARCEANNEVLSKSGARLLLGLLAD